MSTPRTPSLPIATATPSALDTDRQWRKFDASTLARTGLTLKGQLDGGLLWLRDLEPIRNPEPDSAAAGSALHDARPITIDCLKRLERYRVNMVNHPLRARLCPLPGGSDAAPSADRLHGLSLGRLLGTVRCRGWSLGDRTAIRHLHHQGAGGISDSMHLESPPLQVEGGCAEARGLWSAGANDRRSMRRVVQSRCAESV